MMKRIVSQLAVVMTLPVLVLFAGGHGAEAQSSYWSPAGGGGGPLFTQLFVDLNVINEQVQTKSGDTLNGSLYMFGGGGFSGNYNVRIGGGGGSGEVTSGYGTDAASLSVGFGYFDLGFTSPVNSSLTIVTGGRFGGGGATLSVGSTSGGVSFGLVSPFVELEKKVSPSIALVGNVGYLFPFQVGNGSGDDDLRPNLDALTGWTLGLALRFGSF